ncbi:very-short-patch-repair endonuclease [Fluviicoccus keumensis]|uniref:Very-short-patch-repair endonuclease n=1 Tax=Fluviicoccus keumensis TaxID=1435465 RepID=A0A4V2G3W3_9GAMM|nr:endonuclease domain-containing protein [Fluviicoccus keumensis]RZU38616.1 very-short-patch-repair endonuclease [Fluviicoccus keumensis]
MKTYNSALISRARLMRADMTPGERHVWHRCLRRLPYKFRRQRPFGRFIADFYSPELKLVIEIDGDSHADEAAKAYDAERTLYLQSLGLTVLRFTNQEVIRETEAVLTRLQQLCDQQSPAPR